MLLGAAVVSQKVNSQSSSDVSSEQVLGWNLTETDLKTMKVGDLLIKAGGEPALGRIQAKANAPGGQFGMFVKKSKKDNIAPLLLGIAVRLGYYTGSTSQAEKYYYLSLSE